MSQLEPTSSFNLFDKPLENEIIIVTIRTACLLTLAVIAESNENFTYANKTFQQVLTELEILSEEIKKTLATQQQAACTSRTSLSSSMKLGKSSQSLRDLIAEEASDRLKELKLGTRKCAQCGTRAMTMPKCSRCHRTFYCKVECQRTHFPIHKLSCSQIPMSTSSSSSSSSSSIPTLPVVPTTSTSTTTAATSTSTSVPSEITPTMEVEDDESTVTTNSATSSSTTSPSNNKTRGAKKKSKRKSGRNRK